MDTPLLGGVLNSIQTAKLSQKCQRELGMKVTAAMFVKYKTVRELVAATANGSTHQPASVSASSDLVQKPKQTGVELSKQPIEKSAAALSITEPVSADAAIREISSNKQLDFGVFFFGSDIDCANEAYNLVIDCTHFADQNGWKFIFLPEVSWLIYV